MVRFALGFLITIAAMPVVAQSSAFEELAKQRARVSKPALTANYGSTALQSGELRLPSGKGPFPVAVMIHGGCWLNDGDRTSITPLADALTKRGFATWTVGYRRIGDAGGGWPGTFEDIAAAVDHVRSLATKQPLDLSRTIVVGHSSGAHLALWTASRAKLDHAIAGEKPLKVRSVFAIDGPGTLAQLVGVDEEVCGQPVITRLMGGNPADKPVEYRAATPADHLPLGVPTYLVLGGLAPFMQPYVEKARGAGERMDVLAPANANHFNVITPGSGVGDQVIEFIATNAFKT